MTAAIALIALTGCLAQPVMVWAVMRRLAHERNQELAAQHPERELIQ